MLFQLTKFVWIMGVIMGVIMGGGAGSGEVAPGSRLLSQVWAKKQPLGAVAVLFLNAHNVSTKNITVHFSELGVDGSARARDVWNKKAIPGVHATSYTALNVPPQDSHFILLSPT